MNKKRALQYIDDLEYADKEFFTVFARHINWHNPQTYNEKIQLKKISDEYEKYYKYADKYAVRSYIEKTIGKKYLIPLVGVYTSTEEIKKNLAIFPHSFALKATHGSGWNIICKDKKKINWKSNLSKIDTWLQTNYYEKHGRERQYKNIQPRIIVEEFLSDENGDLPDYKFFCFKGKVKFIQVDTQRFTDHKRNCFDKNWNKLPFTIHYKKSTKKIAKPKKLTEMIKIAQAISKPFEHVRVDLYYLNNSIFFGELTFSPGNGIEKFDPNRFDIELGELITAPKVTIPKKGVVYTCITGNYDTLIDHSYTNPEWDYVCFTDNPKKMLKNNLSWQIKNLEFTELDNTRNQRWHKLHPHLLFKDYKHSLWVDGNIDIVNKKVFDDIEKVILQKSKLAVAPHFSRDCIYDELKECILVRKDSTRVMQKQIEIMRREGFPEHAGLFETNIVFRDHTNKKIVRVMEEWWKWIKNYSYRDQLSLTYVLWKLKVGAKALTKKTYRNEDGRVNFHPHTNEAKKLRLNTKVSISHLENEIKILQDQIKNLDTQINEVTQTKFFYYWQKFQEIKKKFRV